MNYVACKNNSGVAGCAIDYSGGYALPNCLKDCVMCGDNCNCADPMANRAQDLPTCPNEIMNTWTNKMPKENYSGRWEQNPPKANIGAGVF